MPTYTVANMSGSVGKTTSVVTSAVLLAATGLRVRVIDLDPQANASTWLGYPNITGATIADVLRLDATINDIERPARIIQGYSEEGEPVYGGAAAGGQIDNLTVVPAARSTLDKLMVELPAVTGGVMRLRDALEAATPVDITFIDSPGSNSALVLTALIATSVEEDGPAGTWGLITCTKPAGKESEGIQVLLHELTPSRRRIASRSRCWRSSRARYRLTGGVYREQMEYLQDGFGDKVTPAVRRASIVDEAYTNYLPVPLYGYRAKEVTKDYENVIDHMKRLGMFSPAAINA